jgi:hypothetical protein
VRTTNFILRLLVASISSAATVAAAAPKVEDVPTFRVRARVVPAGDPKAAPKAVIVRLADVGGGVKVTGEWGDWLAFDAAAVAKTLKGYPAIYMKGFPVVTALTFDGVAPPAPDAVTVDAELKFDEGGDAIPLRGELFGPRLGILIWRDENKKPQAATMAQYNRRYWKELDGGFAIPPGTRPKLFPITERFIGGDDDRLAWHEGISALSSAGFNAIMLPPSKPIREIARELGVTKTAWAVYSPPGYVFDAAEPGKKPPQAPDEWAAQQAKAYADAGWDVKRDIAAFAMSDEPGWYYPAAFKYVDHPAMHARFVQYLKDQKLTPADLGLADWPAARPIGRSAAKDLPSRRLFYWSARFFAHDSSRYFAASTKALENAFRPGMPIFTNWNFFAGRFYVPGPVANNADKQSPDAAMGGHDWFEFGKMRGGTVLWTEDWFGDDKAYQWSFYAAKMRSAAYAQNLTFGGYPVARATGDRPDGFLQKVMCLVGHGGKSIKSFVFGPEYNFPGNCYSERPGTLKKFAEVNAMIGAAEDLLWPGKAPRAQVAIVMPRNSQAWDLKEMPVAKGISDATNVNLNGQTVDYMAEVFNLFLALQHANIPCDFVDEDDLAKPAELKAYRVFYLTAPNVPAEGQRGLVEWTKAGGTLVTVASAATRDRYDEPCTILSDALGRREAPRPPTPIANLAALKPVPSPIVTDVKFTAFGPTATLLVAQGEELAKFADGSTAVVRAALGKGRAVHFAWFPGLSYAMSTTAKKDRLPVNFSEPLRKLITTPITEANITPPVTASIPIVETPILLSERGAAITLLNWTGEPIDKLELSARVPFKVRTVQCVRAGKLPFQERDGAVQFAAPVRSVDVVLLRP